MVDDRVCIQIFKLTPFADGLSANDETAKPNGSWETDDDCKLIKVNNASHFQSNVVHKFLKSIFLKHSAYSIVF